MSRINPDGLLISRNRIRVTHKTRLKIFTESINADHLLCGDDEERDRAVSTAGVDVEDVNEHHLQAVLSAAKHHTGASGEAKTAEKDLNTAYIPTPDSTGVVADYEKLYPPGKWRDPHSYITFSDTVEESISFALLGGFIYYMDEHDKEWLDGHNAGASIYHGRVSKGERNEMDAPTSVVISEDEFELIMAVFEKATHDVTELLPQGSPFPSFSNYEHVFKDKLKPSVFALFDVPIWITDLLDGHLMQLAQAIYPRWRERRFERHGCPIIPSVNLNESDIGNESYVCFRRRPNKIARRLRPQQVSYQDKLRSLSKALGMSFRLAQCILAREKKKRWAAAEAHSIWKARFHIAELKRRHPALSAKNDNELLFDLEKSSKRTKGGLQIKAKMEQHKGHVELPSRKPVKPPARDEVYNLPFDFGPRIRPTEIHSRIHEQVEQVLAMQKATDKGWEDVIDDPYTRPPSRLPLARFKRAERTDEDSDMSLSVSDKTGRSRSARGYRLRYGRGGRLHLDRRIMSSYAAPDDPAGIFSQRHDELDPDMNESERKERARRIAERWRYDGDDDDCEYSDEDDHVLVDEYDPKYLAMRMSLFGPDLPTLSTDASITTVSRNGREQTHIPYVLASPTLPAFASSTDPLSLPSTIDTRLVSVNTARSMSPLMRPPSGAKVRSSPLPPASSSPNTGRWTNPLPPTFSSDCTYPVSTYQPSIQNDRSVERITRSHTLQSLNGFPRTSSDHPSAQGGLPTAPSASSFVTSVATPPSGLPMPGYPWTSAMRRLTAAQQIQQIQEWKSKSAFTGSQSMSSRPTSQTYLHSEAVGPARESPIRARVASRMLIPISTSLRRSAANRNALQAEVSSPMSPQPLSPGPAIRPHGAENH